MMAGVECDSRIEKRFSREIIMRPDSACRTEGRLRTSVRKVCVPGRQRSSNCTCGDSIRVRSPAVVTAWTHGGDASRITERGEEDLVDCSFDGEVIA